MNIPEQLDLFSEDKISDAAAAPIPKPSKTPASNTDDVRQASQVRRQRQVQLLHQELTLRTKMVLHLTITNNKRTMMSVRHGPNGNSARVRLQRMFLTAPEEVRKALADWIQHPRTRQYDALFKAFFADCEDHAAAPVLRPARTMVQGKCYNLQELFDELNQRYFDDAITASITWGRDHTKRTRSIRFGSYCEQERLIRIHPRLDQPFVPDYLVRAIVFHEMLHASLGIQTGRHGRRKIHPPEFKRKEEAFPEYEKAAAWIKNQKNMNRILGRPR